MSATPFIPISKTGCLLCPHRRIRTVAGWSISGDTTIRTDLVATFERSLYERDDGTRVARHTRIDVEGPFKYQGYAKALLAKSFAFYRSIDVRYVELDAVGEGALLWPRWGWSLHGPSINEVHEEIDFVYRGLHGLRIPPEIRLPIFGPDILGLQDHVGNAIGEAALTQFARSSREIAMRLNLSHLEALAELRRRGIVE